MSRSHYLCGVGTRSHFVINDRSHFVIILPKSNFFELFGSVITKWLRPFITKWLRFWLLLAPFWLLFGSFLAPFWCLTGFTWLVPHGFSRVPHQLTSLLSPKSSILLYTKAANCDKAANCYSQKQPIVIKFFT